ncbi:hypothetical protein PR048_012658 [Dryococelus australis]|uniref:Uncharacterized protein n=1 Tax=Dryococelus australis TaxID=614101 RepID=A0ABQ9HQE3_9NEOP|nr:hypothetical protein PR048_012658 [Dryococelus australis]
MLQKYNHLFGNCCSDPLLTHKKGIRKSLREITVEKYNEAKVKNSKIIPGKSLCTNCWTRISVLNCATDSKDLKNVCHFKKTQESIKEPRKKIINILYVPYIEEGLFVELDNSDEYSIVINKLKEKIKSVTSVKDKIKILSLLPSSWS